MNSNSNTAVLSKCPESSTTARYDNIELRRRNEPERQSEIGSSTCAALEAYDRVLETNKSETLLIWPQRLDGIAAFHALSALGRMKDCDHSGQATLFFPWSRNIGSTQRTFLVDREFIYKSTLPVLNRVLPTGSKNPVFGYVMALHSLKHTLNSGIKDKRFKKALADDPGLIHPTLLEIMPHSGIGNDGVHDYESHFLQRLRRHTWIAKREEYIEAAVDPLKTPFFFFGVHARATRIKLLREAGLDPRHGGRLPDIILLDLTKQGRGRLGNSWKQAIAKFLVIVHDMYGDKCPPVLAVTDNIFVLQKLRWETVKEYDIRRNAISQNKRPAIAQVILNSQPDLLGQEVFAKGVLPDITVEAYGTDILNIVEDGLKLRQSLLDSGDTELGQAVGTAVSVLQNIVSLPGSPRQFFEFLTSNYPAFERQSYGRRFDYNVPRGIIKSAIQAGFAGANHQALHKFLNDFETVCANASQDNPGCRLFDDCVRSLLRKSTRSIFVFSSELLRGFAEWRIEYDDSLQDVRPALDKKILLVDRREAIEKLDFQQDEQKHTQRIVFVEPYADDFLHVLTRQNLPSNVLMLANLARVGETLSKIKILLEINGIEPIKDKLLTVQTEFERVLHGRIINIPDFDTSPIPQSGILDLTATGTYEAGASRIIRASNGFSIRALDGSELALYTPDALQVFSRKLAKDLQPGDQICVFSPDFVGMAREKLNLTAQASDILTLYHKAVVEAVSQLPGDSINAKLGVLRERMQEINSALTLPGSQAMRRWLDVEELIHLPRQEITPHAPGDRQLYLCFMKALGISEEVACHYWDWGIFWTRSMRIRSGAAFHQVFMGILIDPHAAAAQLPESRRHEVWRIYETAEQHIVTIVSNEQEAS